MSLSEEDVLQRMERFNMTEAQARQLPGFHLARHKISGRMGDGKGWTLIVEERDETGQIQRFIKDRTQHDNCIHCQRVLKKEYEQKTQQNKGVR